VSSTAAGPAVTVCRDCCCGTTRKHPSADHDAQLEALREGVAGFGRVVVSQCLLACERSNVVVVSPAPEQRAAGVKPVWLARILFPRETQAVIDWVREGGPGVAEPPLLIRAKVGERPDLLEVDPC